MSEGGPGWLADQVRLPRRNPADDGFSPYARFPEGAVPPAADPSANRLGSPGDIVHDYHPRAPGLDVPDGHLAIQMANAGRTSAGGHHVPGEIVILPAAEALRMIAEGRCREVRAG